MPRSLSNCVKLTEFNVENNSLSQLPDGLLSSLSNLSTLTLSRNNFTSYPIGGPSQFCTVHVSKPFSLQNSKFKIQKFFFSNAVNQYGT